MTTVWIVLGEYQYYPAGGVHDWRRVTVDEERARKAFSEAEGDMVTLVRIDVDPENGAHFAVVDER
jgi:hypothetical protein